MNNSILCGILVVCVFCCYSRIHCKKSKVRKPKTTIPLENVYDSHPSALLSEEWADNKFLNISPDDSKHLIVDVLKKYLRNNTLFLEFGSGNGQHITHFAQNFPNVTFQPTDYECDTISDIRMHKIHYNLSNIREPTYLDVRSPSRVWFDGDIQEESVHYMFTANLIHASPLKIATGIFEGAARYLKAGGFLFMYGPFKLKGKIYGEENIKLDRELKKKNYLLGLREVWGELNEEAFDVGIYLDMLYALPNNNQILVWKKDELMQYYLDESKIPVEQAVKETPNPFDDDYEEQYNGTTKLSAIKTIPPW